MRLRAGVPQQAPVLRLLGWEQVRRRYVFDVIGYVVMPEHFHLLISEPERGDPSIVMKVLKQTVSRKLLSIWGTRQVKTSASASQDQKNPVMLAGRGHIANLPNRKKEHAPPSG